MWAFEIGHDLVPQCNGNLVCGRNTQLTDCPTHDRSVKEPGLPEKGPCSLIRRRLRLHECMISRNTKQMNSRLKQQRLTC
ncbi:hypothetical protein T265_06906 [Opisthorchis viverrini]|uniref:Uncharacterized protein n=1 Tax=Opisthorchis viverrini TaxID=6198 RepID=A0A074ZQR9_OPIVI|nr:hypothetical protein T265_06906 [Opisthorchis viverrini]KER25670.1 hypothetical protein T265_06906 [Opisthorchis viverrini]